MTYALVNEFDRAFNGFWNERHLNAVRNFSPPVEVIEQEDAYAISLDVPGMKIADINIELKDKLLTISGERKKNEKSYGVFEKSFTLPETAEGEKIEARFEDGVLEIKVPKKEETKPRRIEIQTTAKE